MRKLPAPIALLLLLAFAGCGGDDEGEVDRATGGDRAAIVIEDPEPDAKISSPVTVSGTASVFEATVQLRVLDAKGDVIASAFATATAGAPESGRFSKQVEFRVEEAQAGVIRAFEQNAASPPESSNSELFAVEVPVRLEP